MYFEAGCPEIGSVIGGGQHIDPRPGGELIVPMHGDKDRAGLLARREQRAHENGAEAGRDANEVGVANMMARGVLRMNFDERLGAVLRQALAFARARHGVPVVAHAAGVEGQREAWGSMRSGRLHVDEARLAVRREEAAIGKHARAGPRPAARGH